MAPVALNKPSNRDCQNMGSHSMPVATRTRRRYPRQCKRQFPVEVEEEPAPAPALEKKSTRSPRKLTERRKDMIREFMEDYFVKPYKYDKYGTEGWITSLIQYIGEKPHYGLVSEDIKIWMKNEPFFKSELLYLLPRVHAIRNPFPRRRAQMPCPHPPIQPRPAAGAEDLHNNSQPNNTAIQPVLQTLAPMKTSSNDALVPVPGHPIKMEPEEEPDEDEDDIAPPWPPARPPPQSDASQVIFVCEIEDPISKLSKIVDGIKRGNRSNINFEELCNSVDMLKGMITLTANNE